MKKYPFYLFDIVLILICPVNLKAQGEGEDKKVALENTEKFSIRSESVTGENYLIQVGLPAGYSRSNASYPVLYVLDGEKSFGMTKEIADWLVWSKEIKDIIVVGISYGKGSAAWWEKRARGLYTI